MLPRLSTGCSYTLLQYLRLSTSCSLTLLHAPRLSTGCSLTLLQTPSQDFQLFSVLHCFNTHPRLSTGYSLALLHTPGLSIVFSLHCFNTRQYPRLSTGYSLTLLQYPPTDWSQAHTSCFNTLPYYQLVEASTCFKSPRLSTDCSLASMPPY